LSIAIVFIGCGLVMVAVGPFITVPPLVDQVSQAINRLPETQKSVAQMLGLIA
jgi:predicted PurR-regulated permease PerM